MGVNNKARRAAKARQRAKTNNQRSGAQGGAAFGASPGSWVDERFQVGFVLVGHIAAASADPRTSEAGAAALLGDGRFRRSLVAAEMTRLLGEVISSVVAHGWTPTDLGEIVVRRAGASYLPELAAALHSHAARFPADRIPPAWSAELIALGPAAAADPAEPAGLARMLTLAGAVDALPPVVEVMLPPGRVPNPRSAAAGAVGADAKALARVRALLAKAEATTFDAEAEALTAKAQELISRYALQRLLARADERAPHVPIATRRIWLDAPYLMAKAVLVDAVARANRCHGVISEALGFITLVGEPHDLEAVELLSTSLLVQANATMLRHGSQRGHGGVSRTRAFRQSFLISYAHRIGERLQKSDSAAVRDAAPAERLLPVLRANSEAVQAEFARRFPQTVAKVTNVSDARGWAAGRAAADLALLDLHGQIPSTATG